MKVSVVVANHDYGRFVAEAVESALDQTLPPAEVVVVDDGSTDESREVLRGYEDRVTLVCKEQGGQASAWNEGVRHCTGEVVVFLDADDVLVPDALAQTAAAFAAHPGAAKVQHRLAVVDAGGRPTGAVLPPRHLRMPADVARQVARFGSYPTPPTSGNAFAAWALARALPVPEDAHVVSADAYLLRLAALLGPVVATDEVVGHYRVHGANRYRQAGPGLDLARVRDQVARWQQSWACVQAAAAREGWPALPPAPGLPDVGALAQRLALARLAPGEDPVPGDTRAGLVRRGVGASLLDPVRAGPRRLASAAWFVAAGCGPRGLARRLVDRRLGRG